MKKIFFFIFCVAPIICFSHPLTEEVLSFNIENSNLLIDNTPEGIYATKDNPIAYANIDLISIHPSVDDRISYRQNYLFLSYGFLSYPGDTNGCSIEPESSKIEYSLFFEFKNISKRLDYSFDSVSLIPTFVPIPFSKEELSYAGAEDNLSVLIDWKYTASYYKYYQYNGSCIYEGIVSYTSLGQDNISYFVEGNKTVYFLFRPVLKSQWFKNNHLDFFVFSNKKFYNSQIKRNEENFSNIYLYSLNISYDEWGLKKISSIYLPSSQISKTDVIINPVFLQTENKTYSFVYFFNYTYEGYGKDNFSVVLTDFFSNNYSFNLEISSRINTYNDEYDEFGNKLIQNENYFPTNAYKNSQISLVILPLSFLGILFIIIFLKFK